MLPGPVLHPVVPGQRDGKFTRHPGRIEQVIQFQTDAADILVQPEQFCGILQVRQGHTATLLEDGESVVHRVEGGRQAYVHLARGDARVNGTALEAGDAVRIQGEPEVRIEVEGSAEVLVFDLP